MSDGKYILTKVGQVLESSPVITGFVATVNSHPAIFLARSNPVGNDYPQITIDIEFLGSHPTMPTQEAVLSIDTWLNGPPPMNGVSEGLSKLKPINDEIIRLFNLKSGSANGVNTCLSEINIEENIGLRVVRCLKSFRKDYDWDTQVNKIFATTTFDLVLSENEDFTKNYGDSIII
jgi:hypothetical protein